MNLRFEPTEAELNALSLLDGEKVLRYRELCQQTFNSPAGQELLQFLINEYIVNNVASDSTDDICAINFINGQQKIIRTLALMSVVINN